MDKLKTILFLFIFQVIKITFSANDTENINSTNRLSRCALKKLQSSRNQIGDFFNIKNISSVSERDSVIGESSVIQHVLSGLLVNENLLDTHWQDYKALFKKRYCSRRREMAALSTWKENLRRVARHNQHFLAGIHSYSLQLNVFGDLGTDEYFKKILKLFDTTPLFDPAEDHYKTTFRKHMNRQVPGEVDWRASGFRPKREEQYQCGACYAFAVTHALQAQLYKKHGDWRELSPQQIVDCSQVDGNKGCDGGSLRAALRYTAREGLLAESKYPYTGKKDRCHYNPLAVKVRPRRWAMLPPGDERAMERALATIGPLAVAVNAAPFTFQLYKSGIYDDPFCFPFKLNHAMLLVGYTPTYWLLLNWWGPNWGEDGYIRIRRGFNRCGVANMAAYVEL